MVQSGDTRPNFDPAVADQLSTLVLTTGLNNYQLNAAMGRNQLAAASTVLTLGVQQINMASLKQLTKLTPLAAMAAAQLRTSQDASFMAGLNAGAQVPRR